MQYNFVLNKFIIKLEIGCKITLFILKHFKCIALTKILQWYSIFVALGLHIYIKPWWKFYIYIWWLILLENEFKNFQCFFKTENFKMITSQYSSNYYSFHVTLQSSNIFTNLKHIYICVCACMTMFIENPPPWVRSDTWSIFKWNATSLKIVFLLIDKLLYQG